MALDALRRASEANAEAKVSQTEDPAALGRGLASTLSRERGLHGTACNCYSVCHCFNVRG